MNIDNFKTFNVEQIDIPRVMIGINPFLGYSHFSGAKSDYYRRIFKDVSAISNIIVKATELGVRAICTPADEKISSALKHVNKLTGIDIMVIGTTYYTFDLSKIKKEIILLKNMGARICLLHGNAVDDLLDPVKKIINNAKEMLGLIRDSGMTPGIACHDARAIMYSDQQRYDVKVYATPVNKIGFCMNPVQRLTLKAIRDTDKPVIALKPFASGRLQPEEGLEFTLSTRGVSAVAIGVANHEEAHEDFNLAKEILNYRLSSKKKK